MDQKLLDLMREAYCGTSYPALKPFVDRFREKYGAGLAAIVFYGSKLDPNLASETSFYDFYLICDDYNRIFSRRRDRWLAQVLPPNIYYLELKDAEGYIRSCKYCVISLNHLQDAVSEQARDLYHLGRFSKRLALVWWRTDRDRDQLLELCAQAMQTLLPHALNKMGDSFTLPTLIHQALALSYEGEVRLEKTDEKVRSLYRSAESFYLQVWARLLAEHRSPGGELAVQPQSEPAPDPLFFRTVARPAGRPPATTRRLIERSRRRARARWPKNIVLVDNWVDILLAKVERTYGVKLELTPRERRWVLILGWKHFFRLRREGKIH